MEGELLPVMRLTINRDFCKGCSLCIAECSQKLLSMSEEKNRYGVSFAEIREMRLCTGCSRCAVVCPECAIEIEREP
jgi:2-oxoglutarate ferredoxin oxidoreductase subunit delta